MFSLTSSQVIVKGKIGFYFPEITLTTEFPCSNLLLPTFSIGRKQDFQVANLPLVTVNFEPWFIHISVLVLSNVPVFTLKLLANPKCMPYLYMTYCKCQYNIDVRLHCFCKFVKCNRSMMTILPQLIIFSINLSCFLNIYIIDVSCSSAELKLVDSESSDYKLLSAKNHVCLFLRIKTLKPLDHYIRPQSYKTFFMLN